MEYLSQVIARTVSLVPERAFIVTESETLTYTAFASRTAKLANALRRRGIGKGDRVGLYLPSTPLMAVAFWACQRLGAIPAPLSAMFRHAELRKIIAHTEMKGLIADASTWPYFAEIRDEFAALEHCLVAGVDGAPDSLSVAMAEESGTFEDVVCDLRDIACLFFTSGTTGSPKGTAQTHFSIVSTLRDMMVSHRNCFGSEIYVCAVPLFTNFGLNVTLNLCLYCGGTIVLHEQSEFRARARRHSETSSHLLRRDADHASLHQSTHCDQQRHDLRSLRVCTTGGSPGTAIRHPTVRGAERRARHPGLRLDGDVRPE